MADWLVLAGFALCLGGSSIYLPYPLRPFHWGLALFVLALAIDPSWRAAAWNTRLRLPLILVFLLLAIQPLWTVADDRYARYATYLLIGGASAVLGETIARRQKPFLFLFPWLLAYWFITAYFPVFDAWTAAQRFRPRYLLTGGVWDNINDMATVLVFANLIWLLCRRRLSLLLFGACWFYALLLNRRADLAATLVLGVAYFLCFVDGDKLRQRLKMTAVWALATVAALQLTNEPLHLVSLPHIQAKAPVPADLAAPPQAKLSVPPAMAANGAAMPAAAPPARTRPPLPTPAPPAPPQVAAPDPRAPAANVRIKAQNGDESTAFRARLTMDMWAEARAMPWWQWITGLGAGQLDLTWPGNKTPWASPHFFWLEMFFHIGLMWFALLAWLALRLDWRGRMSLLVAGLAGLAPSSMVYFQPFWVFLGVLVAGTTPKNPVISSRRAC
ncbi:hypothetical protein WHX56_03765 [Achromobacter veterisilvae]|uniref:Uncharacterized protein n=1 Tax=Achromobacter veterisilvae TaxID=2069367 RepID=A0ABZ2S169_9BURK